MNDRDPQGLANQAADGRNSTDQKIAYLRRQGVTVIFDSFGVRLQQLSFKEKRQGFKSLSIKRIRSHTIDGCIAKFKQGKWE